MVLEFVRTLTLDDMYWGLQRRLGQRGTKILGLRSTIPYTHQTSIKELPNVDKEVCIVTEKIKSFYIILY